MVLERKMTPLKGLFRRLARKKLVFFSACMSKKARFQNALTSECGEFDESTGASYVDNDHCYGLGAISRTAEGFLGPAEGFA